MFNLKVDGRIAEYDVKPDDWTEPCAGPAGPLERPVVYVEDETCHWTKLRLW